MCYLEPFGRSALRRLCRIFLRIFSANALFPKVLFYLTL